MQRDQGEATLLIEAQRGEVVVGGDEPDPPTAGTSGGVHHAFEQRPFAVVALDIDHFKRVNDNHGHDAGDRVLQELARLMGESSREDDVLCRVGGEEFLMLLPNASVEVAAQVAERLRALVEQTPMEPVGRITVSLGVAHWPRDGSGIDQVLKRADEMLYRAKQHGRNRVETADAR